jgi:hypothetical protein
MGRREKTDMALFWDIFILIITLAGGIFIQFFARLSPWIILPGSFAVILCLPSFWGYGLVLGFWFCCAFNTFQPEQENKIDAPNRISALKIFLFSLLTFSGFILTLILLWKLKLTTPLQSLEREIFAWIFLGMIEVSLYKIIARLSPGLYRIPMGYGIAVLNFLMLLYWIFAQGIVVIVLTLFTLLIINPLLLSWVEPRQQEPFTWRR